MLWVHIGVAYWLAHDWSHAEAMEFVAERTESMIGVRSGVGIYANFVVALVWSGLVCRVFFSRRDTGSRQSRIGWLAECFLWAMFFSAAVVFAKPISAACFLALFACVGLSHRRLTRVAPARPHCDGRPEREHGQHPDG